MASCVKFCYANVDVALHGCQVGTVQDTVAAMPLLVTLCRLSMVSKALETLKVALNILGRC